MQRHFDLELDQLHGEILTMGSRVQESIAKAIKALVTRNDALATEVERADTTVDRDEILIDEHCQELLALHHPEARDLRLITMVFKINSDLERIGDLAVNISKRVHDLLKEPQLKPLIDIPDMAEIAQGMVSDSLKAFVQRDAQLAREVCARDDRVDKLNEQIFRELLTYMLQDGNTITRALGLIMIGRYLERIADHATNIAEDVVYLVEGQNIKHRAA